MPDLLFDASSLVKALKLGRVELLYRSYAQWLTFYEVLNAVWKEVYLSKTISAGRARATFLINRFFQRMRQNRFVRALGGAFSIAARVFSILFFNFPFRKDYFLASQHRIYKPPPRFPTREPRGKRG
jgi:predicted nucleic acid-binding protein